MRARGLQFGLLTVVFAIAASIANAQMQVLPEMPITGSGAVTTSFIHSNQTGGIDTFNAGFSGDFSGYYYNPSFLQFQVTPYYDLGREFSETEFVTGGKGVGASLNLFSGGTFPLNITYHRATTNEATYNLIGSPAGVGGNGMSQDISVNWTIRLRKLPTVQLGYVKNDGDFTVLGTDSQGSSHGDGYSISSQYTLLGFSLMALFDSHSMAQELPSIFNIVGSSIDTRQKNLRFGVSRNLSRSTSFDSSVERSHWISDLTGRNENRTFDTATAGVNSRLTSKLSTSFRANYSSDLTGLWLASLVPGGSGGAGPVLPGLVNIDTRFRALTFNEGITYNVGHGFQLQGTASEGKASDSTGRSAENNTVNAQVSYTHAFKGGTLATGYSIGVSTVDNRFGNLIPNSQLANWSGSTVGHSGSLGYSRQIGRGQYTTSFHYSQSDARTPLLLASRSYGGEISAQNMIHGWNVTTAVRLEKINVDALNSLSSLQKMFRFGVARGRFNVAFVQQFTDGLSGTVLNGLQPIDPNGAGVLLGRLFVPTVSHSTSLSATYVATKRLEFNTDWIRSNYDTTYLTRAQSGTNDQFDFIVKYRFRQLDCRAGYRRYYQDFSGISGLYNAQTVYFQVSRRFHLF